MLNFSIIGSCDPVSLPQDFAAISTFQTGKGVMLIMGRTHECRNGWKIRSDEPVVFQIRLRFVVEEEITEILVNGEKVAEIPFIVDDPASCRYILAMHMPNFNLSREQDILSKYVFTMRHFKSPCRLMVQTGEEKVCCSIIMCPNRRWDVEKGRPKCVLK